MKIKNMRQFMKNNIKNLRKNEEMKMFKKMRKNKVKKQREK